MKNLQAIEDKIFAHGFRCVEGQWIDPQDYNISRVDMIDRIATIENDARYDHKTPLQERLEDEHDAAELVLSSEISNSAMWGAAFLLSLLSVWNGLWPIFSVLIGIKLAFDLVYLAKAYAHCCNASRKLARYQSRLAMATLSRF